MSNTQPGAKAPTVRQCAACNTTLRQQIIGMICPHHSPLEITSWRERHRSGTTSALAAPWMFIQADPNRILEVSAVVFGVSWEKVLSRSCTVSYARTLKSSLFPLSIATYLLSRLCGLPSMRAVGPLIKQSYDNAARLRLGAVLVIEEGDHDKLAPLRAIEEQLQVPMEWRS